MVGMVVTISPNFNLYRMVVLPAASSPTCKSQQHLVRRPLHVKRPLHKFALEVLPTMRMRISFLEKRRANNFVKANPILKQSLLQVRYSRYANTPAILVPNAGPSGLIVPFRTGFLKFSLSAADLQQSSRDAVTGLHAGTPLQTLYSGGPANLGTRRLKCS